MAEYGSIPARLNGVPIPALGDVSIQQTRTVNQKPTTDRIVITYGPPKYQATLTFPNLRDKATYLAQVGANLREPRPHNLGFDLDGVSFTLLSGIPSGWTAQSNQDGDASLQLPVIFESFQVDL